MSGGVTSPCGPDGAPCAATLVAAQIIENDDVAWGQCWREHLLDIGCEQLAIDWTVDHPGRLDAVVPQGGDEGQRLPVAVRHARIKTLPAQVPTVSTTNIPIRPAIIKRSK